MNARTLNSARVYLRRSTSNQESSLEMQLNWAIDAAKRVGIPLRASMDDVTHMQSQRLNHYKDIYLDDAISGSRMKRPAARRDELRTADKHIGVAPLCLQTRSLRSTQRPA